METDKKPCLAIVVPCYNEASAIEQRTRKLLALLEGMQDTVSSDSRVLYVNDGSSDATWSKIEHLHAVDTRVSGINLAHSSGYYNAQMVGIGTATRFADLVVLLGVNQQDDEKIIKDKVCQALNGKEHICDVCKTTAPSRALVHVIMWLGVSFLVTAIGITIWVLSCSFLHKPVADGMSLLIIVWLCGGCVLIGLGIVGEYIGKIYVEYGRQVASAIQVKDELL